MLLVGIFCIAQSERVSAYWQSRDSTYNDPIIVSGGVTGYQGPGDIVSGALAWWGLRGYNAATTGTIATICDATTGLVCVSATWSGGVLTLPTVGGVLCNNTTNVCEVAELFDQSGNTNCTTACSILVGHGSRPTLLINCLGSLPCMSVAGVSGLTSGNLVSNQAQPYTLSTVALRTSGAQSTIASYNDQPTQGLFATAANTVGMYAGTSVATAAATDNVVHTLQFIFNNASSVIYADAASNTVNIGTTNGLTSGHPFNFPSSQSGGLTGQVFEAGWWGVGFNGTQNAAMHTNQCSYWGTTC